MYRTNSLRAGRLPRKLLLTARALLASAVLAGVLLAPATAGAGVPDQQQQDTSGGVTPVVPSRSFAQTFTAGITGNLDQVDLFLVGGLTYPLTVEIQAVSGGLPNGTVLASASVPAASVPDESGSWIPIPIGPVAVTAGTQYAIVASVTPPPPDSDFYGWSRSSSDVYADGTALMSEAGMGWFLMPFDQAFRTYVAVSTAVSFRSFSATRSGKGVLLRWRTASEVDLLGFNVYRELRGKKVKVNRFLIRARGAASGAAYRFLDRGAMRTSGRYWLQAVNLDGSRSWLTRASAASRL